MILYGMAELEAERTEHVNRLEAIGELVNSEEGELTDELQTEITNITDVLIPAVDKKLEQEEKLNAIQARKIQERIVETGGGNDETTVTVPARAKATNRLKYFENESDAYISGQWALAALFGNDGAKSWCEDRGFLNVMGGDSGPKGGFLVPEEMQRTLTRLRESYGIFPQKANVYPMGSDNLFIPRPIADATAYWVGENTEITASDVDVGSAELTAKKIGCLTRFSTEIDEDSVVDIGEMVTNSMAYAMAKKIDEAGFNGDGSSTYGGIKGLANALHANATIDAASGNTSADALDLLDFENVVGALPSYEMANGDPEWYMSKPVYVASYVRLMNALGGVVRTEISGDQSPEIMGYKVNFTNSMTKTTGASVSTIVGYFGWLNLAATYGRRRSANIAVSTERYFEFDQIGVRATERAAITVHEKGDDINQRPILSLKTAAS